MAGPLSRLAELVCIRTRVGLMLFEFLEAPQSFQNALW